MLSLISEAQRRSGCKSSAQGKATRRRLSDSQRILAEQREPLIKVAYASKDGQVKELVHRRPPPNRFAMSEQDVDDVAFLTGEISLLCPNLGLRS